MQAKKLSWKLTGPVDQYHSNTAAKTSILWMPEWKRETDQREHDKESQKLMKHEK